MPAALGNVDETQLEHLDREIARRINHAGTCADQLAPLAVFYIETKFVREVNTIRPVRLQLILVPAENVQGAADLLFLWRVVKPTLFMPDMFGSARYKVQLVDAFPSLAILQMFCS